MQKYVLYIYITSIVLAGCGGTKFVDLSDLPDTYQCEYMEAVCKEAREFEREYNTLSADEKKDAETVLKTYRNQCNDALERCRKSSK